jgi:hypothetical protein
MSTTAILRNDTLDRNDTLTTLLDRLSANLDRAAREN